MEEVIEGCYQKIATIEKSAIAKTLGNMALHKKSKWDGISNRRKNRKNC